MNITKGRYAGKRGRVIRSITGKSLMSFGGTKYKLSDPDVSVVCLNKEEWRSFWVMFFIALLAITVVGLILAIPLFIFAGKRQAVTVQINTPKEKGVIAILDRDEWRIMSKYIAM